MTRQSDLIEMSKVMERKKDIPRHSKIIQLNPYNNKTRHSLGNLFNGVFKIFRSLDKRKNYDKEAILARGDKALNKL